MSQVTDRRQSVGQGESPRVESLTDDRTLDTLVGEARDGDEITESRHATRCDDGRVGRLGDLGQQLEIRPAERAVLADVGDDITGAAVAVESGEDLPQVAAVGDPSPTCLLYTSDAADE